MGHFTSLLNGLGLGLAAMYFFDPSRGRYRQSLVRGQLTRCLNDAECFIGVGWRDLRNRTSGMMAEMSHSGSHPADDQTLEARVRSKLGRVVSHPRSLEVTAQNGSIHLGGQILESEAETAIECAKNVCGVQSVESDFQRRQSSEDFAELVSQRTANTFTMTPATQLMLATAGASAIVMTCARRAPLTFLLGSAALLAFAGESHARQRQQQLASRGSSGREEQAQGDGSAEIPSAETQRSATQPAETMASR